MKKRTKVFVGFGVIIAAIMFLVFTAFSESSMYFLTVDEVLDKSAAGSLKNKPIRVQGAVVPESVKFDINQNLLQFQIKGDSGRTLWIRYAGLKPDNMGMAVSAIVEGKVNAHGAVEATKVMMQCPSKYEAKPGEQPPAGYNSGQYGRGGSAPAGAPAQ